MKKMISPSACQTLIKMKKTLTVLAWLRCRRLWLWGWPRSSSSLVNGPNINMCWVFVNQRRKPTTDFVCAEAQSRCSDCVCYQSKRGDLVDAIQDALGSYGYQSAAYYAHQLPCSTQHLSFKLYDWGSPNRHSTGEDSFRRIYIKMHYCQLLARWIDSQRQSSWWLLISKKKHKLFLIATQICCNSKAAADFLCTRKHAPIQYYHIYGNVKFCMRKHTLLKIAAACQNIRQEAVIKTLAPTPVDTLFVSTREQCTQIESFIWLSVKADRSLFAGSSKLRSWHKLMK